MNAQTPYNPFAANEPLMVANIVPAKFEVKYKDKGDGSGELKAEEWVEWHVKLTGNQTIPRTCRDAVHRIRRGAEKSTEINDEAACIWRAIEPHYKAWKEGRTARIVNGTPLEVWPGLPHDVVELLSPFRIYSVEDLSMAGDALLNKIPDPNMLAYRDRAKKFLATKDIAIAVKKLDESEDRVKKLEEMVEKLQKSQADADFNRREAERELDEVTPAPARKRKA